MLFLIAAMFGCAANLPHEGPVHRVRKFFLLTGAWTRQEALVCPRWTNWESFDLTDRYAAHGRYSAHLALRAEAAFGGHQNRRCDPGSDPRDFLNTLSVLSHRRVDRWTPKQYLQRLS